VRQRGKIVRPLDTPRLTAATVGVSRTMGDVLNQAAAQWEPRLLANLYAGAALEADDAHAEEHDLICQHYGISKTDLILVLDLAASALDGRHAVPNHIHDNCPSCDAAFALGRICNTVEWTSAPTWRRDRPGGRPPK
jgi:hypothetical protein